MTKIEQLQRELRILENNQNLCKHEWSEPFKKTFTEKQRYDTGDYDVHGVHHYPIYGTRDINVEKWVRVCKKCEKQETTTELKDVVIKKEPYFR